jgi:hypothetical protein
VNQNLSEFFCFREEAVAQTANDLVGAWTLVSITLEKDGEKTDFYGPNPQGRLMYDASGHFSVIISRSDLPRFASNNRGRGTAEENKAIVQGSLVTSHVESSTFPNWNGTDGKTLSTSRATNSARRLSLGR